MKALKILCLLSGCALLAWVALSSSKTADAEHECCAPVKPTSEAKSDPAPKGKGDTANIDDQKARYPLDVCVVRGNKLGEHGEIVDHVYKGRLVRFCCKGCISAFEKDPATYLAKLDEAAKTKTKQESATVKDNPGAGAATQKDTSHSQH